jgi:serine phosphatase RsbU (regulator of sigma subunit)/anti-sigma regulatory factor (Ser/Thr protein kinase)
LEPPCSVAGIREAAQTARAWLEIQGAPAAAAADWELVLVEAGNNAVAHTPDARRALPVQMDVSCGDSDVEAQVTDHTAGCDLPDGGGHPDRASEGARGLLLMKSLTDHAEYWRGPGGNTLVLRKKCLVVASPRVPGVLELQARLSESEAALAEMAEELSSSYESLVAMFRYSAELGASGGLGDFAKRLLSDLAQLTAADVVILRLVGQGEGLEPFLTLPEDLGAQLSPLYPAPRFGAVELEAVRTREDLWFGSERPLDPSDPLGMIPRLRQGVSHAFGLNEQILGTITLARSMDLPFRSAQISLLHTFADFLGIQVVNTRLLDERTRSHLAQRELEIAANIQRSLLPVRLPPCPPFELAASCLSARAIGGDYYDAIPVGDQGVLLVIADVMGKGVPAALFAAVLRSTVRSMPSLFTEPAALLAAVNRTLCDDLARVDMFVTAQVAFLNIQRAEVTSARAGHAPLLIWRPGAPSAQPDGDAGIPLGIDAKCEYSQTTSSFPPGAVGVLYTDGVTESRDQSGQMFGDDRVARLLPCLSPRTVPADRLCSAFLEQFDRFRAGAPLADDQTFILIRHTL